MRYKSMLWEFRERTYCFPPGLHGGVMSSGSWEMRKTCTHGHEGNDTDRWTHMHKSLEPRKHNLVKNTNRNSGQNGGQGSRIDSLTSFWQFLLPDFKLKTLSACWSLVHILLLMSIHKFDIRKIHLNLDPKTVSWPWGPFCLEDTLYQYVYMLKDWTEVTHKCSYCMTDRVCLKISLRGCH